MPKRTTFRHPFFMKSSLARASGVYNGLEQANISQDTFKKLINYCRFESQ
jgi:hypothetical protein